MVTSTQMIMRLIFASAVGAVIGFEKQIKGHPLGIRTNVPVCVSSTTIMMLSKAMVAAPSFTTVTFFIKCDIINYYHYFSRIFMKYKLMAVDMDGTLLNPDSIITPYTENIVKQAVKNGLIFTLCTGRPLQGVKRYVDQLELDCPVITYNGAVIVHSKTEEILFSQSMDTDEARRVYNLAKQKSTMFIIWSRNRLYASEISEKTHFYEEITNTKAVLIEDFEKILSDGITKMLWYDNADTLERYIDELEQENFLHTTFTKSRAYFLEFFSNKTSKAVAMEKLGEYFGISKEEMIAVGDQTNDLPMLQYAGLDIAMGNAVEKVKAAADYITATNSQDGVAQVILKYFK